MTISAFRKASLCLPPSDQTKLIVASGHGFSTAEESQKDKNEDSDSEDEEVMLTCSRGLRADYEFDSSSDDEEEASAEGEEDLYDPMTEEKEGVVLFVSKRVPGSDSPLVRPKPTAASALSPFNDMVKGDTQTADSESSGCCVKKQSVPFSLHANGGNTDEDNGGEEDEDTSDEESLNSSSSSIECDEIDNVSKVVSDCTDEINADEIEVDYFSAEASEDDDDDELSGILEALNQSPVSVTQDEMEASDRIIGVMEDREDVLTIPKVKRVLSYGKLVELSEDAQLKLFSPKRPRLTSRPPTLLEAFAQNSASVYPKPAISMDEDDENCSTLKDELFNYGDSYDYEMNKEKTPVPLLTPPSSPLIFELDGDMTTVCEWPSNLVVDSAMAAVCELRPMSPASLEHWELRDAELTAVDC